jgi:hypothetical protein
MSNEPQRRKEEEIERLLVQLRDQVAQLRGLEQASRDGSDLHASRHAIAALHWRLARASSVTPTAAVTPSPPDQR